MTHKTELWGLEKKARLISMWKHDGMYDVQRSYSQSSGHTIGRMVALFQLHETTLVLSGCGSERWNRDLNRDQFKALVSKFRKSAEKAGFTNFGVAQM